MNHSGEATKKNRKKNARALELSSGCWQDGVVESRAGIAKSRRNEATEGPKDGGTKKKWWFSWAAVRRFRACAVSRTLSASRGFQNCDPARRGCRTLQKGGLRGSDFEDVRPSQGAVLVDN